MFKKSFVSLSFSSEKLQILKLNSAKKRVEKLASIDLPKGQIENLQVVDTAALAQTLKNAWLKLGLKEKAVVIAVPEFSTFTQLLSLPELDLADLDESVHWQAQDFLPVEPKDMVMDWKIVKKEAGSYQILALAMSKKVLRGYVDSVVLAGLYPLAVETPSLSLVRLSGGKPTGKLIVYNNFGEGILVVAQEEKIFGSSIVDFKNHDELIKTAKRIIAHYSNVKVEELVIGGPEISAKLSKRLEKELVSKIAWMKPEIKGLSEGDIQEYLIPISLQMKELAAPSDENTVNLLPVDLVKKYENAKLRHQVWSLSLTVSLIVWISFFSTLGVYLFLSRQVSSLKKEAIISPIPSGKAEVISQIDQINQVSDKVLKIAAMSKRPQDVLNAVFQAKPVGVTISEYKVDLESGKVELSGSSLDRKALIDFKQRLEEVENFSLVQIPLSNLEKEENLDFRLNFIFLPAVSKKQ